MMRNAFNRHVIYACGLILVSLQFSFVASYYNCDLEEYKAENCTCHIEDTTLMDCSPFTINIAQDKVNIACCQDQDALLGLDKCPEHQDLSELPKLHLKNWNTVEFQLCPLTAENRFLSMLQQIGVEEIKSLNFAGYITNSSRISLRRDHFAGINNLKKLTIKEDNYNELPDDVFDDLGSLETLVLDKTNLTALPRGLFKNLKNLEDLDISNSHISSVDGVLTGLSNLKELKLRECQIKEFGADVFNDLTSVQYITLNENPLETLDAKTFQRNEKLQEIYLNKNMFVSLPKNLFNNNPNLEFFALSDNKGELSELPNGLFQNLTKLNEVWITITNVVTLPEDLFTGAIELRTLNLYDNHIKDLPANLFSTQSLLSYINLKNNKIEALPDALFRHTINLKNLNLSFNKFKHISSLVFDKLKNLEVLNLNDNQITNIGEYAFNAMSQSLIEMNLSNNFLSFNETSIQGATPFQQLEKIEILNLHHNSIEYIYNDWMLNNPKLKKLDLSHNKFRYLELANFQFVSKGVVINLSDNYFDGIHFAGVADFDNTTNVNVRLERITVSCDCHLYDFVSFLTLDKYASQRELLKIKIPYSTCNEDGDVVGEDIVNVKPHELVCKIESKENFICPKECICVERTDDRTLVVNCANQNLTKTPQLPLPKLIGLDFIELNMSNNLLTNLPPNDLMGYSEVAIIYAQNNKISKIAADNIPKNLRILNLENNELKTINAKVLSALNETDQLEVLALNNNPWSCECDDGKSLLTFVQTQRETIVDYNQLECVDGRKFALSTPGDFCKSEMHLYIILASIIAALGISIGLAGALYYKYQQEIKVWLYAHNLCLGLVTEEVLDKDKKYDAFISYSEKDEDFITDHLMTLEEGLQPYKLCVHKRDWIPGEAIQTQIVNSVENSRRTIVVVSPNFVESEWGRNEFRTAHSQALNEGRARVIVIIYGELGDIDNLDTELKTYLKLNTYVKWGDPWFWDKLRYALPHKKNQNKANLKPNIFKRHLQFIINEKLIRSSSSIDDESMTTPPANKLNENPLLAKLTVSNEMPNQIRL